MATDKKSKAEPASKSEPVAKDKTASVAETSKAETAKPEAAKAEAKAEPAEAAAAPKGYTRGEGQKPVTQAYKDNWNAIYGKKKKKR
jgi:hypothetical protein